MLAYVYKKTRKVALRIKNEVANQYRGLVTIRGVSRRAAKSKIKPQNIHLFTHARGGSTLLAEAISSVHQCPIVWEPFFKGRKPFKEYSHKELWGWKEHVPCDASHSSIDEYFEAITSRRFLHPRFFTGQSIQGLHHTKPLVYKYCFANFLAPYLIRKFNLKCIILDRHPAQIIASRKRYGGFSKNNSIYSIGSAQTKNSREIFALHEDQRSSYIKSSIGVHAWNYCLIRKNYELLRSNDNVLRLNYDDLVLNPLAVSEQLSNFFGLTFSHELFKKKSRVTVEPIAQGREQLMKWETVLSPAEINEIKGIVHDVFGFYEIRFDLTSHGLS